MDGQSILPDLTGGTVLCAVAVKACLRRGGRRQTPQNLNLSYLNKTIPQTPEPPPGMTMYGPAHRPEHSHLFTINWYFVHLYYDVLYTNSVFVQLDGQ